MCTDTAYLGKYAAYLQMNQDKALWPSFCIS